MRRRGLKESGFVLLIALVVIVLAGTVLATSARLSSHEVFQASAAEHNLQVRWGMLSCKTLGLASTELMMLEDVQAGRPVSVTTRRTITLGSVKFHLVSSDEQAKANVNLLAYRRDRVSLEHSLRALQFGLRNVVALELRPVDAKKLDADMMPIVFTSYDQLFPVDHPSRLIRSDAASRTIAERVTCWGNGQLNFKRAERVTIRQVTEKLLDESQIDALIDYRRRHPDCGLMEVLARIELKDEKLAGAMSVLTDVSFARSLWVIAEGRTRNFYRFYVVRTSDGQDHIRGNFEW